MTPEFVAYQKQVIANAKALGEGLQQAGFRIVSGGTDSHLILVDVFAKGIRGKEAEKALDDAYITVNKNAIPFDVNPPLNPSGIRLGSPAVTTRGFREAEMREVAALISDVLHDLNSQETLATVRRRVTTWPNGILFTAGSWRARRCSSRHNRHAPPDCPRCPPDSGLRHRHLHSESGPLALQD